MGEGLTPFRVRHSSDGKWCVDYGHGGLPVQVAACFDDEAAAWERAERDGLVRLDHFTPADSE
jgi:hypothetical protein